MNYTDIIKVIEEEVKRLIKKEWNDDVCPPEFWVSLDNYDMNNQRILLTISHLGSKFSRPIFPVEKTEYGYDPLIEYMKKLYNQTM